LWPESSEEHLLTSIAEVPSATRFAQDDGFAEGLKQSGGVCENHERSKKVTGSRDDKGKGFILMKDGCWIEGVLQI
jgi:hypothetical protein